MLTEILIEDYLITHTNTHTHITHTHTLTTHQHKHTHTNTHTHHTHQHTPHTHTHIPHTHTHTTHTHHTLHLLATERLIEALAVLFLHSPVPPFIHCENQTAVVCLAGKETSYDVAMTTVSLTNIFAVRMNRNIRKFFKGKRRNWREV